jgi:hypothetical protein
LCRRFIEVPILEEKEPLQVTQRVSTPVPDPTELTDAAIAKSVTLLTQYINGKVDSIGVRLDGMDKATDLRLQPMADVPSMIDEKVHNLERLAIERFESVNQRFVERDTRSERESRDNKVAVDAAFAAQKEAAAKQDEANAKAIDKSEKSTAETIKTNQELTRATTDALIKAVDEVKTRVTTIESMRLGARDDRSALYAGLAALGGLISLLLILAALFATRGTV